MIELLGRTTFARDTYPVRASVRHFLPASSLLLAVALLTACDSEPMREVTYDPAEAAVRPPLELDDPPACHVDSECAAGSGCFQGRCVTECYDDSECVGANVCNARGRCASPATPDVPNAPATAGTSTATPRQTRFRVLPGQLSVLLQLDVAGAPPSGGFAYSLDRSDDPASSRDLFRVASSTSVSLPIATGLANPDNGANATVVDITVYTPVGRFAVELAPAFPASGAYTGAARMTGLGARGVPLSFQIVTNPPNASLADATDAYVVLDVSNTSFFSPHDAFAGAPQKIAARLQYEPLVSAFVAKFDYTYDPSSDAQFPTFTHLPVGQVGRALRVEVVEADNGEVNGRVVDRWFGMAETVNSSGVIAPREIVYVGPFDARRTGSAMTAAEVAALPATTAVPATPGTLELPAPASTCGGIANVLVVPSFATDEDGTPVSYNCGGLDLDTFVTASPDDRARCAIAVARHAIGSQPLSQTLTDYLTAPAPGDSFAQFLENCADPAQTVCRPSPEVLCARTLLANASRNLTSTALEANMLAAFQDVTREATLGPQLAAYKRDSDARFEWLQSANVPPFVAAALESENASMLQQWADDVLTTHYSVLATHLDQAALAAQAIPPIDQDLRERRQKGLLEASQAWRAAADATLFLAQRLNGNVRLTADRVTWANYLRPRARYLYLTAGLLQAMQTDVGGGAQAAAFGGVFGQVTSQIALLSGSFNNLLFARDAEVVVSTSLDPTVGNAQILSMRQQAAQNAVATAKASVDTLIDRIQNETLDRALLEGRFAEAILETQNQIIDICGLPSGCSAADYRNGVSTCRIRAEEGKCGFVIDGTTEQPINFQGGNQSVSQAGRAVLRIIEARNQLQVASAARSADLDAAAIELANLDAFASDVQRWNAVRQAGLTEMQMIFSQQTNLQDAALRTLVMNFDQVATTRLTAIEGDRQSLLEWDAIRNTANASSFASMQEALRYRTSAEGLRLAADGVDRVADAIVEGLPKSVGTANDVTSVGRSAALIVGMAISLGLQGTALGLDNAADQADIDAERTQALAGAQLDSLMAQADVDSAVTDQEIEALYNAVQQAQAESQAEIDALARAAELAREQRSAELRFAEDLAELRDRRAHYLTTLLNASRLELEQNQAELNLRQAVLDYSVIVQQASLATESLALLQEQSSQAGSILGSPAAVFAGARRLEAADMYLQQARDSLMEWLVALEYFAVRPFVDMRIRIVLARNADQLLVISNELTRLQNVCGGPVNSAVVDASLRSDLIRMQDDLVDPATGLVVPAEQRFQDMLRRGAIPVDRRVRYSSDSTIGTLLSEDRGILSASFDLPLDEFTNLAQTCNAKLLTLEVQLRGDLGTTTATPSVTVLYDGMSTMRSCQSDILSYVENFGTDPETGRPLTSFSTVTQFHTEGRSATLLGNRCDPTVSGQCDANWSGNSSGTFSGLPLSSQYTVFIDPTIGRNSEFNWANLEDIVLRVHYNYQDPYTVSTCVEQ